MGIAFLKLNMLNQIAIVGILESINRVDDFFYEIVIEVPRNFKDVTGGFKSDHITVKVWKGAADSVVADYALGLLISIVGRIETDENKVITLVGEKVDFLGRSSQFKRR